MTRRRILIVDDVIAMRSLLKGFLKDNDLLEADTATKAIELINGDDPPELVLLDQSLEDKSGLDVLKETSAARLEKNIKVCFVTGHRDRETVVGALSLGANDYIVKPVDILVLKSKIEGMFGSNGEAIAVVPVRLSAKVKDLPLDIDLIIKELSELGIAFESNLKFQTGKNILLESPTLNDKLNIDGVMVRIDEVIKNKGGFRYKATFIGIGEATAQKIRQFTHRKIELKDEIERASSF